MLPNRFPDAGQQPDYNSVDASLWFIIAAYEYLQAVEPLLTQRSRAGLHRCRDTFLDDKRQLHAAIEAILESYAQGARYHIGAETDGLLAAGEAGVQLTCCTCLVRVTSFPCASRSVYVSVS